MVDIFPKYQQEFNNIIECIKGGLYEEHVLSLRDKGPTDEDAAQLCAAIRIATEAAQCNIIKLDL